MIICMCDYSRYIAVTNRRLCEGDYLTQIRKIAALHPRALILREKDLSQEEYTLLAARVAEICRTAGVPCFLHSHIGLAKQQGYARIHLSFQALAEYMTDQKSAENTMVSREISGHTMCGGSREIREISVSCHSLEEVKAAAGYGASQILLGNIFETDCKKGLPGKGLEFLQRACEITPLPVYAIGGVKPENMDAVLGTGAAGGCMMSGFMRGI